MDTPPLFEFYFCVDKEGFGFNFGLSVSWEWKSIVLSFGLFGIIFSWQKLLNLKKQPQDKKE